MGGSADAFSADHCVLTGPDDRRSSYPPPHSVQVSSATRRAAAVPVSIDPPAGSRTGATGVESVRLSIVLEMLIAVVADAKKRPQADGDCHGDRTNLRVTRGSLGFRGDGGGSVNGPVWLARFPCWVVARRFIDESGLSGFGGLYGWRHLRNSGGSAAATPDRRAHPTRESGVDRSGRSAEFRREGSSSYLKIGGRRARGAVRRLTARVVSAYRPPRAG